MTEKETRTFREKLVQIMKAFDAFCKEHNLRYSIAYGTMIGAIRHKGLIPWDDDIDLYMPRPEYEKFLSLTSENGISEKYKVIHYGNTGQYYLQFAKVIDSDTTLVEYRFTQGCPIGVFIDIVPVDGETDNVLRQKKKLKEWERTMRRLWYINYSAPAENSLEYLIKRFWFKTVLGYTPKKLFCTIDRLAEDFNTSQYMRSWAFPSKVLEKSWFDDLIEVEFEGLKVKCFKEYDKCLTLQYGDYMQLPPEEQRISNHSHYILELDKGHQEDIINCNKAGINVP